MSSVLSYSTEEKTDWGRIFGYLVLVVVVIFFFVNIILHHIEFKTADRLQGEIDTINTELKNTAAAEPPIIKYSINATTNTTTLGTATIPNQLVLLSNASSSPLTVNPLSGVTVNSNVPNGNVVAGNALAIYWVTAVNTYLRVQ